jgi:hypothetical protein
MIELQVLLPAFFGLFGQAGGELLRKAAEKHVEEFFGKVLDRVSAAGQKSAFEEAMARAYGGWIEAVLKNLDGLGYDAEDLAEYKGSFERLLDDREVGEELARPILDGEEWSGPEPRLFADAWTRLGGKPLPGEFRWPAALAAFERQVRKQRVLTPELREVLNAVNLDAIRDELRRQGGVRPEGNERRYAAVMRQRYRVLDLLAIARPEEERLRDLELRDVFLPQDVRENPPPVELPWDLRRRLAKPGKGERAEADREAVSLPDEIGRERLEAVRSVYAEQPKQAVLTVLSEPASRRSVLLGDPGSGKSTLARYLLLSVLDPPREAGPGRAERWAEAFAGCLPLLIEIREFIGERSRGNCQTFLEFLHFLGKTQGYALEETWLAQRLKGGPSLVIFDGLDEIFNGAERERMMHEIVGFVSDYPRALVLVTSRPVGYKDGVFRAAGFRHFALQDLDDEQVQRFVRGWYGLIFPGRPEEAAPRVDRVLRACEQSRSIRLLAGNPMLLTIMAMIARQQELPRERARFYEYSAEILCHHWEMNRWLRGAGVEFDYIGLDDKTELLRRIAFRMQAGPQGLAGNFIHGDELQEEIEAYLVERYRAAPAEAKRVAVALIEQLHARNYILCLYGPGLYGFVHRTFLEYFCAAELRRRMQEDPGYSIDRLIEEVVAKHWQEPAWNEVLRLLCGMVGDLNAGRIITFLTEQANPFWYVDPERRPPRHLVIATQCLAEVRNRYAIEGVCLALLQAIMRVLESHTLLPPELESWRWTLTEALSVGVEEIGPTWPGSGGLGERPLQRIHRVHEECRDFYVRMVVSLFPSSATLRSELESLARRHDIRTRLAALGALARRWPQDPAVRELLEQCALQDRDSSVCAKALSELAGGWPQDPAVRELLNQSALLGTSEVRKTAFRELARGWPQDPAVRRLLEQHASQEGADYAVRRSALTELARGWPQDPAVRRLLEQHASQEGEDFFVRKSALAALGRGPQDPAVRRLLEQHASQEGEEFFVRKSALAALARGWPQDPAVRQLLEQCAVQDRSSDLRHAALSALAGGWPQDPAVRQLLEHRAVQDEDLFVRSMALIELGRGWPQNQAVRKLLEQRAAQDNDSVVRGTAFSELGREWPQDPAVRQLLEQRALQDENSYVRSWALVELARGWPQDPAVRQLIEQFALQDDDSSVRIMALSWLAQAWPQDPAVRQLVEQRALRHEDSEVRSAALRALGHGWPQDPAVRLLLRQRARQDEAPDARQRALQMFVDSSLEGVAAVILSQDLSGREPFLDPLDPVGAEHLAEAARVLGVGVEALEVQLEGYSRVLGWDLREGLGPPQ